MRKIVGFMASYNLVSQGYPCLESLYAGLNVCDSIYIGDGSNDGTEKILERLSQNKRIKVYRREWKLNKLNTKNGWIQSDISNSLLSPMIKNEPKNTIAFNIQANEVIHEDSYNFIKSIPETMPNYKAWFIPYLTVYYEIEASVFYRLRLVPLSERPFVFADSWTMSLKRRSLDTFKRNVKLSLYYLIQHHAIYDGLWANHEDYGIPYPPKPIYRYARMFIENQKEKLINHKKQFRRIDYQSIIDNPENLKDWKKLYQAEMHESPDKKRLLKLEEHPKIMQYHIGKSRYEIREELIEEILRM